MYKGEVMQHGPRAGQKIETYKDLADYLEWQYANGLITEKQRDDTLIVGQVDFPGESNYKPSPWKDEQETPQQDIPKVDRHQGLIIRVGDIWVQAAPLPDWSLEYIEYPEGMRNQYRDALQHEHVKLQKVTDRRIYFTES
jgi:hypothetical protein